MIDDQSSIDQRCFESFREIRLAPDADLGAIMVAGTYLLSAPGIMNIRKAIVRSHITAYIDTGRIVLFNGPMPENEIKLAPSLVHEPEVYDEYIHKMLFEWYGNIDRVTIISGDRRITQKILEAPNLHDIVSVTGGEVRDEMPLPPIGVPIEHYPHFKASYHAEGHSPKEVRIYTNVPPVKLEFDRKYESKFGFDMPFVQEILAATEDLAYKARAAAKGFTEHARNKQFTYDSLPDMIKPYYERNPVIARSLKSLKKLRGVDALNFLTQSLVDRDLNEWYASHPDYKDALQHTDVRNPNDPLFVMNPFYSIAGIARCQLFELASGQDLSMEKEFFKELLYFSLLNAFLDVNQQKPEDNPWIRPTGDKMMQVRGEVEKKIIGVYARLK